MGYTKFGDSPLSDFQIHRISALETGYTYYEFIHAKGLKLVMRESENLREYKYAKGTFENRASLSYINYDLLA